MRIFLSFLLVACLGAAGLAYYFNQQYNQALQQPLAIAEESSFMIAKGTGYNQLAQRIERELGFPSSLYLKLYARQQPAVKAIKAGEYALTPGMTALDLLDKVVKGDNIQYRFTIVEGTNFEQLKARLNQDPVLIKDLPDDAKLLQELNAKESIPEGLFLADTYYFERGESQMDLLTRANRALRDELAEQWGKKSGKSVLKTPYEALILASIIEKETGQASERPVIAGVFNRRLIRGMKLQTDPTVIYGLGANYRGNITRKHLRTPTPYNTYVIPALPPTPIATVGPDAIAAAVNPAAGRALYFVAKGDGSHAFSNTLAEHNRAVRQYQLKRRKNYRSSP